MCVPPSFAYRAMCSHLIRSSRVPRVSSTRPQRRSLKLIPLLVPPHAWKITSASLSGTNSPSTSLMNACLVMMPLRFEARLKASLSRLSSDSASSFVIEQGLESLAPMAPLCFTVTA
ncbi:unnamed protein product [Ixodes persulcatus]